MEFRKIYFDMDGVLADFDGGVSEILGLTPVRQENHTAESDNLMFGKMKEADHFYRRLKAMEDSVELFNELYGRYGSGVVEILSGIPSPKREIHTAGDDKIAWVKEYLPEGVKVNVLLRRDKVNFCRGREYVLIDDFSVNVRDWEKAGGSGILFVSPDQVREDLNRLASQP